MAGVDVSEPMVRKLLEKAGGAPPFPLVLGDATALPFRDAAFGAALLVHVLHLIPGWPDAVDELARVVRPGGVVLFDSGGRGDPASEAVQERMDEAAGLGPRRHPGLQDEDWPQLEQSLVARGARTRELPPVPFEHRAPIEEQIAHLQDGLFSWTWPLDPETRRRAAEEVRAWARQEYGDLEEPRAMAGELRYRAYDLPEA
jgi:SAM-dependent methyltransferase